jgi:hypothetical protein
MPISAPRQVTFWVRAPPEQIPRYPSSRIILAFRLDALFTRVAAAETAWRISGVEY